MAGAAHEPTRRLSATDSSPLQVKTHIHERTQRMVDEKATVASDQRSSTERAITKTLSRAAPLGQLPRRSVGGPHDDYELLDDLGAGGMATVQFARQASLRRLVALKRLRPDAKIERQRMFLAEAMITASLDHHHIIPIYDMGLDQQGQPFYAMKLISGRSWEEAMPNLDFSENLRIFLSTCEGVAYAHGQGILHRDLKPANVMLGPFSEVRVMDWGLAERQELSSISDHVLGKRLMVGTPAYMSPEMARGDLAHVDERTDIYLLGGCLFHLLTGVPPHDGGGDVKVCLRAAAENRLQPAWQEARPERMAYINIAWKALSTDPTRRYQSVDQLMKAVRHAERFGLSQQMTLRARRLMQSGEATKDYDTFARAIYCCEEALANWGGNDDAIDLLSEVQLHYAQAALERGDYDLAESMLHPAVPIHATVWRQLQDLRTASQEAS
jgi:serine/threonine protein kinase